MAVDDAGFGAGAGTLIFDSWSGPGDAELDDARAFKFDDPTGLRTFDELLRLTARLTSTSESFAFSVKDAGDPVNRFELGVDNSESGAGSVVPARRGVIEVCVQYITCEHGDVPDSAHASADMHLGMVCYALGAVVKRKRHDYVCLINRTSA